MKTYTVWYRQNGSGKCETLDTDKNMLEVEIEYLRKPGVSDVTVKKGGAQALGKAARYYNSLYGIQGG